MHLSIIKKKKLKLNRQKFRSFDNLKQKFIVFCVYSVPDIIFLIKLQYRKKAKKLFEIKTEN